MAFSSVAFNLCLYYILLHSVWACRSRVGIHCLPPGCSHDAHASGLVSVFLPHDHSAWIGQSGTGQTSPNDCMIERMNEALTLSPILVPSSLLVWSVWWHHWLICSRITCAKAVGVSWFCWLSAVWAVCWDSPWSLRFVQYNLSKTIPRCFYHIYVALNML